MLAGEGQVWTRSQACCSADVIASPSWVSRHCGLGSCWSDSREGKQAKEVETGGTGERNRGEKEIGPGC